MGPFYWSHPTTLLVGAGGYRNVASRVSTLGRHVLLITDSFLLNNLPDVSHLGDILKDLGLEVSILAEIPAQPTRASLLKAAKSLDQNPDVILAVGGGSVLDFAKVLAISSRGERLLDSPLWDTNNGAIRMSVRRSDVIPTILIPTTLGTGAEVSGVASISDDVSRKRLVQCLALRPSLAVLDCELTRTLPRIRILEGIWESFLRLFVGAVCDDASSRVLQDEITAALLRVLLSCLRSVLNQQATDSIRETIALTTANSVLSWALAGRTRQNQPLWVLANAVINQDRPKVRCMTAMFGAFVKGSFSVTESPIYPDFGRLATFGAKVFPNTGKDMEEVAFLVARDVSRLAADSGLPTSLSQLGCSPDELSGFVVQTRDLWTDKDFLLEGASELELTKFYEEAFRANDAESY